jgi:hypothetical protein
MLYVLSTYTILMEHDTQNNFNMHHSTDPVFGTVLMSALAVASGIFGFLEHLDLLMGVMARVIAILAGCASLIIAYQTYAINQDKIDHPDDHKTTKNHKRL